LVDIVSDDVEKASKEYFERLSAIPLDARMRTKNALREEMTRKIMEKAARDGDKFVEHVMKPATQVRVNCIYMLHMICMIKLFYTKQAFP